MARLTSHRRTGARYPTLRVVGAICSGVGAILLTAGALLFGFTILSLLAGTAGAIGGAVSNFYGIAGFMWSLGVLGAGLQFLGAGALCRLAIHVEENTRASAQCLEALRDRLGPRREDGGPMFVS